MRIFFTLLLCFLPILSCMTQTINKTDCFVTPEDFGCVSDNIEKADFNAEMLQRMIDFAINNGRIVVANSKKHYYISKSLMISDAVTILFNRATIIATDTIDLITIKDSVGRRYSGVISGLSLDLNNKAKSGIKCPNAIKVRISNSSIKNIPAGSSGIIIENGYEIFVDNIHLEGGENNSTGILINTHDCHFSDIVLIDCHTGIDNKGSNFFERIHGWMGAGGKWIDGSTFFKIRGGGPIFLHQCFSDTFDYGFQIECNTNLYISQFKNFHNKMMWRKDVQKIHPVVFHFANESIAKESSIFLESSHVGGLFLEGINRQRISNFENHHLKIINSFIPN